MVATSWPGSTVFPHVYRAGIDTLETALGLVPVEYPSTGLTSQEAWLDPKARADDLNAAFADPDIAGVIAVIGGDDSIRILPHLDLETMRAHPKVLMGYSDTATQLTWLAQHGIVTFNGPAVMAGFAQAANLPGMLQHVRDVLFNPQPEHEYRPYSRWTTGYPDWGQQDGTRVNRLRRHNGWRWLRGSTARSGRLFGGCIEVLDMMVGTRFWPEPAFFDDRILFVETSEDVPPPAQVGYWLRNFGAQGILNRIAGLVVGRPRGYTAEQVHELDRLVVERLEEWHVDDIPVVSGVDVGHTDPQFVLPNNVLAELDPIAGRFRLLEPAVL
ncbi:S66 peptidase family protein [Humibacter sp. RRB41]|uniref:S66 family peptidase n=1 Tax=Humibacter sp. RRB41 TaxID=2919946 RepID=UPI001FAA93BA|nr:S66 peptidase family protein [Humibacter sp. RRB41]